MNLSKKEKQRLKTQYGDWAIVTGASSGIGLELATQLAEVGFNLILNARNEERLLKVEQQLEGYNIEIKSVVADLSARAGVERIIQSTQGLKLGLLINNAGYGTSGLFVDASLDFGNQLTAGKLRGGTCAQPFFCPKIQATTPRRNYFPEFLGRISGCTLCCELCRIQSLHSIICGSLGGRVAAIWRGCVGRQHLVQSSPDSDRGPI